MSVTVGDSPADGPFEIFCAAPPGLESVLAAEMAEQGFPEPRPQPGGVAFDGGWPDVWRANLSLRCAVRILARVATFRAPHLAQLDKRARRVAWSAVLRPDVPVRVEANCKRSRIYHAGAAAQRIGDAITAAVGAPIAPDAPVTVFARLQNDLCVLSVDTSGDLLHRRGFKQAVGKAPLRETLAAAFLRACDYDGRGPVVDPMCGSGTLILEAADMALGLAPGRGRSFAFEQLVPFDPEAWETLRGPAPTTPPTPPQFYGYDRDAGAIAASNANAARSGADACATFAQQSISDLTPPDGPPGLVIVNPPYGARIGDPEDLRALYSALGRRLRDRFAGWRVGIITSDAALARAAGLRFDAPGPPVPHGALKVRLWRADIPA